MQTDARATNTCVRSKRWKEYFQMSTQDFTPRPYANQLELWRDVVGYDGIYQVSNLGRVKRAKAGRNTKIGRMLKPRTDKAGYTLACFYRNGRSKWFLIHRLVAFAFLGDPPTPEHQVNHKNSIRDDNRVVNLEWVTRSENIRHGFKSGFACNVGERNTFAKLTWKEVREIRRLFQSGTSRVDLAKQFKVCKSNINQIIRGVAWIEQELPINPYSVVHS